MFRILKFLEKPKPEETASRLASPVFYCLRRETLPLVTAYTQQNVDKRLRALGRFMVGNVGKIEVNGTNFIGAGYNIMMLGSHFYNHVNFFAVSTSPF